MNTFVKKISGISPLKILFFISFAFLGSVCGNYASAWIAPAVIAPNGNAATLIHVGQTAQFKEGSLGVDGNLAVIGPAVFGGKIRIQNGTEGAGKYLTSDAKGKATWQELP